MLLWVVGILLALAAIAGLIAFFALRRLWRWLGDQFGDDRASDRDVTRRDPMPRAPGMGRRTGPAGSRRRPGEAA